MFVIGQSSCLQLSLRSHDIIRYAIIQSALRHHLTENSSYQPKKFFSTRMTTTPNPSSLSTSTTTAHSVHNVNNTIDGVLSAGFQPTAITRKGVFVGSTYYEYPPHPLPELDVSALMDKRMYCVQTAKKTGTHTNNGNDAAIRLMRGKMNLVNTMQHEFEKSNRRYYMLRGHGVPTQLLQHHLDTAHRWLEHYDDAKELAAENIFGVLKVDRLVIQSKNGMDRKNCCFPKAWDADMLLYLTVMNRMALHLSTFLENQHDEDGKTNNYYHHEQTCTPKLKEWSVSILKEQAMTPALIPSHLELTPMVELARTKNTGPSSEGRVCIRLQGSATTAITRGGINSDNKKDPAVSTTTSAMIFHCVVDLNPESNEQNF